MPAQKSDADVARGEHAARGVLKELGQEHLGSVNLDDVAMFRGALVRDCQLTGCEGRLSRTASEAVISVSSAVRLPTKRRFIVAHELGHFELHRALDQLGLAFCTDKDISEIYDRGPEREANAFATELLMPRSLWTKRTEVSHPTLEVVDALATEFNVSLTAAAIRFVKLSPERCCVVFCQNGQIGWVAPGPEFSHWIEPGRCPPTSLAASNMRGGNRVEPEEIPAKVWIDDPAAADAEIWEHSVSLPSLGGALSLLWIPAHVEEF